METMNEASSSLELLNSLRRSGTPGAKMVDPNELPVESSAKASMREYSKCVTYVTNVI
jgi:hypothetical protein